MSKELDAEKLRHGLHHSYTNKNKYIKHDIAVEFEILATILDLFVNQSSKETFHKYLRSLRKVIANNVYQDSDNTFKSLNNLRNNNNIIILSADKEICTVILNRTDYIKKLNVMIVGGISQGKYGEICCFCRYIFTRQNIATKCVLTKLAYIYNIYIMLP